MKTGRFGLLCGKSNGHFTISLPVRFFVNHRKNYHFAILSESNHKPTLVSIKWTFWAYLEFTSFNYIVIITIFHLHGLNTIIEHLRYKKLRFFLSLRTLNRDIATELKFETFLIRYKYHFYNLRSAFSLFSIFDGL